MTEDKTNVVQDIDEDPITRGNIRLWKLTGRQSLGFKGRTKKSVEAELEFYLFNGGKTKSVRNRIIRLEKAIGRMSGRTDNE